MPGIGRLVIIHGELLLQSLGFSGHWTISRSWSARAKEATPLGGVAVDRRAATYGCIGIDSNHAADSNPRLLVVAEDTSWVGLVGQGYNGCVGGPVASTSDPSLGQNGVFAIERAGAMDLEERTTVWMVRKDSTALVDESGLGEPYLHAIGVALAIGRVAVEGSIDRLSIV